MAIIIDLKNAIRKAIYTKDNSINFYFNTKILKTKYPYVFLYISSYNSEGALNKDYLRKRVVNWVLEYAKSEDNTDTELYEYEDTLLEALESISYLNLKKLTINQDGNGFSIRTVEGVLQITFKTEIGEQLVDDSELMKELDLTINLKGVQNGSNTTKI